MADHYSRMHIDDILNSMPHDEIKWVLQYRQPWIRCGNSANGHATAVACLVCHKAWSGSTLRKKLKSNTPEKFLNLHTKSCSAKHDSVRNRLEDALTRTPRPLPATLRELCKPIVERPLVVATAAPGAPAGPGMLDSRIGNLYDRFMEQMDELFDRDAVIEDHGEEVFEADTPKQMLNSIDDFTTFMFENYAKLKHKLEAAQSQLYELKHLNKSRRHDQPADDEEEQ